MSYVGEAAARGFEIEDIDADGDGSIDFQAGASGQERKHK